MKVYTKIAALYLERQDEWGQFDGSVHGLYLRSAGAALAAGATAQNMSLCEISHNIRWASDYIATLDPPQWTGVFPDKPIDVERAQKGKDSYIRHCDSCHGHPEDDQWAVRKKREAVSRAWVPGERDGIMEPLEKIKTDPERVTFRGFEEIPERLSEYFPRNHPFYIPRDQLRPKHRDNPDEPVERAYINKRMHGMFSRAPFLHNASVLTLAELINLQPRRAAFYRGWNTYDPEWVGLAAPEKSDSKHYFRFDTATPGNSNKGHDYPWPRSEVEHDQRKKDELKGLLEYLKTL
jgi:hypothetical protein